MKNNGFVVEDNMSTLGFSSLCEPEINHLATDYFVDNYENIVTQARKMVGVDQEKVEDLVHDVFASLRRKENRGEGFDISYSRDNSVISVADYVFGSLKKYSLNSRYRVGSCERRVSAKGTESGTVSVVHLEVWSASSADENDLDSMRSFQKAYSNASSYDDGIEAVDETLSIRDNIEFCLDFNEQVGFDFLNLFKNIDLFGRKFDPHMFDSLRRIMEYHTELGDAFRSVIEASKNYRAEFDMVVASI